MVNKYGCLMLYFVNDKMKEIQSKIDKEDVYEEEGHGLTPEGESHVTICYGFDPNEKASDILNSFKDFKFTDIKLGKITKFSNDKFDVLKYDIESPKLTEANKLCMKNFEITTDYPNYHAHSTIAYLKPTTADKYIEMFKNEKQMIVEPKKLSYSYPNETLVEKILKKI